MFDIATVQTIFGVLMSDLSAMFFLAFSLVFGILAALLGIGLAVHYTLKYVAKGGAKEMGMPSSLWTDHVNWGGKDALAGTGLGLDDIEREKKKSLDDYWAHEKTLHRKIGGRGEHFDEKLGYWFDD